MMKIAGRPREKIPKYVSISGAEVESFGGKRIGLIRKLPGMLSAATTIPPVRAMPRHFWLAVTNPSLSPAPKNRLTNAVEAVPRAKVNEKNRKMMLVAALIAVKFAWARCWTK